MWLCDLLTLNYLIKFDRNKLTKIGRDTKKNSKNTYIHTLRSTVQSEREFPSHLSTWIIISTLKHPVRNVNK